MVANTTNTNKVSPNDIQKTVHAFQSALEQMKNPIEAYVTSNGPTMSMGSST